MKRLFLILTVSVVLASCEIVIVEPYDVREEITGIWDLHEYSETYRIETDFPVTIRKDYNSSNGIWIRNFYDVNIEIYAIYDGYHITIPLQEENLFEVEGSGNFNGRELYLSYSVFDIYTRGPVDFCVAEGW